MTDEKMVLVPAKVMTALAQMLQQQPAVALYLALMACKEAEKPEDAEDTRHQTPEN